MLQLCLQTRIKRGLCRDMDFLFPLLQAAGDERDREETGRE
jgi:hypothetical protein